MWQVREATFLTLSSEGEPFRALSDSNSLLRYMCHRLADTNLDIYFQLAGTKLQKTYTTQHSSMFTVLFTHMVFQFYTDAGNRLLHSYIQNEAVS